VKCIIFGSETQKNLDAIWFSPIAHRSRLVLYIDCAAFPVSCQLLFARSVHTNERNLLKIASLQQALETATCRHLSEA
jgi:hypothetical protein